MKPSLISSALRGGWTPLQESMHHCAHAPSRQDLVSSSVFTPPQTHQSTAVSLLLTEKLCVEWAKRDFTTWALAPSEQASMGLKGGSGKPCVLLISLSPICLHRDIKT